MNIVFMGTPDFAVPALESLIKRHNVLGVFSQPDKPVGRKRILTPPQVKVCAEKYNIPVFQPNTLKDGNALDIIKKLNPDIIVVIAYGKILPDDILNYPKYGCINVHASLLPKYRGAAPIQWAVINGDSETGVSVMQMDSGLDTGDVLNVEKTKIKPDETSAELFDRLSLIGSHALLDTLDEIEKGTAAAVPQPKDGAVYAEKITKSLSPIDWSKPALSVHNLVRGLQTWPCAQTLINGRAVKIHKTALSDVTGGRAGEVVFNDKKLTVACGDGKCVDICELQLEGKKRVDVKFFLLGNKVEVGTVLGE